MIQNRALMAYRKTSVETADIASLVIMCYEAIIRDLEAAKAHHLQRSMNPAYEKIRHTQDLITELLIGLDFERGGEIAVNLSRLYNYALRELMGINSTRDIKVYDDVGGIFTELKEAWEVVRQRHGHEESHLMRNGAAWNAGCSISA